MMEIPQPPTDPAARRRNHRLMQLIGLLSGIVTLGFGTLVTTAFLLNGVQTAFDVASSTESCQ